MPRIAAVVIIGLLKVCSMWAAAFIAVKWSLSQQHLIHLLGVIVLGGGSIAFSVVMTTRIYKGITQLFVPGR